MSLKTHLSSEVSRLKASSSSEVVSWPEAALSSILLRTWKNIDSGNPVSRIPKEKRKKITETPSISPQNVNLKWFLNLISMFTIIAEISEQWIAEYIELKKLARQRCMLFIKNSFSRVSAPRSEQARGNDKSSKVRTGFGVDWEKPWFKTRWSAYKMI